MTQLGLTLAPADALTQAEARLIAQVHDECGELPPLLGRFLAFHRAQPHVYRAVLRLAEARVARGVRRIGMKGLWEDVREELESTGQPWAFDNSYTSLFARLILIQHPEWAALIETRKLRLVPDTEREHAV
jgi:hypothetical protein